MSIEERKKRLEYLMDNYRSEIDKFYIPYSEKIVELDDDRIDCIDLLDVSLYQGIEFLGVSAMQDVVNAHLKEITPPEKRRKAFAEHLQQREAAQSEKETACEHCGAKKWIHVYSKACDGNYFTLPSGRETEGYAPALTNLTDSDGCYFQLCVSCARIKGVSPESLKADLEIIEREYFEDGQ